MQETALVTGASGLVGRHLVRRLLEEDSFASAMVCAAHRIRLRNPQNIRGAAS